MRAEWFLGVLCACSLAAIVQADETESAGGYTWLTKKTGEGGIGAIHPGWHDGESEPTLLVKTVDLPSGQAVADHVLGMKTTFEKLADARGKLGGSNIMQVYDIFYDNPDSPTRLIQAIEMAPGSDLAKIGTALNNHQRTVVARDLFRGLAFLHSHNLAHQDMKRHNVMFDGALEKVTIVDLDLLDVIGEQVPKEMSVYYVTLVERAPLFSDQPGVVSASDDVWAGSLVVLGLFCGDENPSLAGSNLHNAYWHLCNPKRTRLDLDAFVKKFYGASCTTDTEYSPSGDQPALVVIPEVFQAGLRAGLECAADDRLSAGELAELYAASMSRHLAGKWDLDLKHMAGRWNLDELRDELQARMIPVAVEP